MDMCLYEKAYESQNQLVKKMNNVGNLQYAFELEQLGLIVMHLFLNNSVINQGNTKNLFI